MLETEKINSLYKNIFGDTRATIAAIQKFIDKKVPENNIEIERNPADSVNRVLNSVVCEETNNDIQKIIKRL